MATLVIPNIPPDLFARLTAQAARANRTVEEEALALLGAVSVAYGPTPPSVGLQYIPSPEISAPFDLKLPGPGVRVVPRDIPPPRLEFWFGEDKVAE